MDRSRAERNRTKRRFPLVVAGKTGTPNLQVNYYDAWFIFFAPADHPIIAAPFFSSTSSTVSVAAVAAPIAKAIMESIPSQAASN